MALTLGNSDVVLGNAATVLATAPVASSYTVLAATALNTDNASHTITLYRVAASGSPGVTNEIIQGETIAAGATMSLPIVGLTLTAQQTIQALADTASKVNLSLSWAQTS